MSKVETSRKVLRNKTERQKWRYPPRKGLRSAAIDDLPSNHRHVDPHLLDVLIWAGQNIFRKHDEIREFARLDRALCLFLEGQVGVVDGLYLQRLLASNLLARSEDATADRVTCDEVIENPQRRIGNHG